MHSLLEATQQLHTRTLLHPPPTHPHPHNITPLTHHRHPCRYLTHTAASPRTAPPRAGKEDEFSRFTAAYKATQPERIYAQEEEEEGEGEEDGGQ